VASPSQEYANPAPTGTTMLADRAAPRSASGASASTPSTASEISNGAPAACWAARAGAVRARSGAPTATAATASASTVLTRSCSSHAAKPSRKTRLAPSRGCTSVNGAWASASACNAQPASPSPVPTSQRGLATSRRKSDSRSACSGAATRASAACIAIPAAYRAEAPPAAATPMTVSDMPPAHDSRLLWGAGAAAAGAAAYWLPAAAIVSARVRGGLGVRATIDDRAAVALTFDDGPHPEGTPAILDILAATGTPATFFLAGEQVRRRPAIASDIVARGHGVGVHCHRHRNLMRLTPRQAYDDLRRAAEVIAAATGLAPRHYRPPYGILTAPAVAFARSRGWEVVLWRHDGADWAARATPDTIRTRLLRRAAGGDVLLLHDADHYSAPHSWRRTARALPAILEQLQAMHLRVVPLG
jgi:peptidoglycan-N-acetylglucosamine deacetylase